MSINKSDLLMILPAFNEASVIGEVIVKIREQGYTNICVINDGSEDATFQKAIEAKAIVLTHPINRGAGAAIQTGILYARKRNFQYAIMMDCDGQHLAVDIQNLCAKMEETKADIVIGNRFEKESNDIPKTRIVFNRCANLLTNFFCKKKYADTQSGFRILNRKAIENINLKNRGFGFCSEMLINANQSGLNVEETPIQVIYSDYSLSKGQSLLVGIRTAKNILWQVVFN